MNRRLLFALVLIACAVLYVARAAFPGAQATSLHTQSHKQPYGATLARLMTQPIPARNLYRLANELKLRPTRHISRVLRTSSPDYPIGHTEQFHILSEDTNRYFTLQATIVAKQAHIYLYMERGLKYTAANVQRTVAHFEHSIYPTDRAAFGTEWRPGVDGDPHVVCLVGDLRSNGVGGYYSAEDEYPHLVNPYSNEHEMIYMNSVATVPGDTSFNLTLSHEFQHMIHANMHPHDNAWLNEGMSMLAEQLNHYHPSGEPSAFISHPDTQLNSWSVNDSRTIPHYGGAYLFLSYLYDRYGSTFIHDMLAQSKYTDFELVNRVLALHHIHTTANTLFNQWVVANLVHDRSFAGGVYGYKQLPFQIKSENQLPAGTSYMNRVPPYAAQYENVDLPKDGKSLRLTFKAPATVPIVNVGRTAPFWWSNKGDMSNTQLERTVDLTHVPHATLQFRTWYDIEKNYDYGYVEVSRDRGHTWQTVPGQHTRTTNPTGANYGAGYTGKSKGWISEKLNLSPYVGHVIKLRFQYITDDEYNGQGMVVKNIRIPEIGFRDTFSGWKQQGWLLIPQNALPSHWMVQLVGYTASGVKMMRMPIQAGQGSMLIQPVKLGLSRLTAIIYTEVPKTTNESAFTLSSTVAP